jgi:hypothetical protein
MVAICVQVERALEHESAEEQTEAIVCYQRAAAMLHTAAKEKTSAAQATYFKNTASEYLVRCVVAPSLSGAGRHV